MYIGFVALTMLVLPVLSVLINHVMVSTDPLMLLVGKWFVFWGVGVRLGVAGVRQYLRPAFTAKEIFHMEGEEVLPLVKELGISNIALGVVGLASLAEPTFVLPVAIAAGIFYGAAGLGHIAEKDRSLNENVALWSDLFLFAVLAVFVVWSLVVYP